MHLRRVLALATAALVLPFALTACGEDATSAINNNTAGVSNRDGDVDVLGAVIVSAQPDAGTFIASFANNSEVEAASVTGLEGVDTTQLNADPQPNVEIAASSLVNLANDGGIAVTGSFEAGDFVPVSITFQDGSSVELDVPVVTSCDEWEGLDGPEDCAPEAPVGAEA